MTDDGWQMIKDGGRGCGLWRHFDSGKIFDHLGQAGEFVLLEPTSSRSKAAKALTTRLQELARFCQPLWF